MSAKIMLNIFFSSTSGGIQWSGRDYLLKKVYQGDILKFWTNFDFLGANQRIFYIYLNGIIFNFLTDCKITHQLDYFWFKKIKIIFGQTNFLKGIEISILIAHSRTLICSDPPKNPGSTTYYGAHTNKMYPPPFWIRRWTELEPNYQLIFFYIY